MTRLPRGAFIPPECSPHGHGLSIFGSPSSGGYSPHYAPVCLPSPGSPNIQDCKHDIRYIHKEEVHEKLVPRERRHSVEVQRPKLVPGAVVHSDYAVEVPTQQLVEKPELHYKDITYERPRVRERLEKVTYDQPVEMPQVVKVPKVVEDRKIYTVEVVEEEEIVEIPTYTTLVEVPHVQVVERPVDVPKICPTYKDVEVPQLQIIQREVQVPKVHLQEVPKPVEVTRVKFAERDVEVPKFQLEPRMIEVPKFEWQEELHTVTKFDVQKVQRTVEVPHVRKVKKYVEVPQPPQVIPLSEIVPTHTPQPQSHTAPMPSMVSQCAVPYCMVPCIPMPVPMSAGHCCSDCRGDCYPVPIIGHHERPWHGQSGQWHQTSGFVTSDVKDDATTPSTRAPGSPVSRLSRSQSAMLGHYSPMVPHGGRIVAASPSPSPMRSLSPMVQARSVAGHYSPMMPRPFHPGLPGHHSPMPAPRVVPPFSQFPTASTPHLTGQGIPQHVSTRATLPAGVN
ncbi:AHNAK [Symbiodinium sp. CCMP2456]|nr:AHNAK [Symbiodinium sp. CCMP2456]